MILQKFHNIMSQYGETEVDFLGIHISKGQYHLQPHIVTYLDEFFDEKLTFKQVQQFFGIVNKAHVYFFSTTKKIGSWNHHCTKAIKALKKILKILHVS